MTTTGEMDFVLSNVERDAWTNKTIFGSKLTRTRLPSPALSVAQRFRFETVGKNLKAVKPYVATTRQVALKANKPVAV